jgi:hypothetical protein
MNSRNPELKNSRMGRMRLMGKIGLKNRILWIVKGKKFVFLEIAKKRWGFLEIWIEYVKEEDIILGK